MSIFEVGMLVCFGFAWPVNIAKAWKSRTAVGQSVLFLAVLDLGYIFGIIHKLLYSRDIVLILYMINFAMVFINICLFFRNRKLDQQNGLRQ